MSVIRSSAGATFYKNNSAFPCCYIKSFKTILPCTSEVLLKTLNFLVKPLPLAMSKYSTKQMLQLGLSNFSGTRVLLGLEPKSYIKQFMILCLSSTIAATFAHLKSRVSLYGSPCFLRQNGNLSVCQR